MSDLSAETIREVLIDRIAIIDALEEWGRKAEAEVLVAAAEKCAYMLEGGQTIWWCEAHHATRNYSRSQLCDQKLRGLRFDNNERPAELEGACTLVERRLLP